MKKRKEEKKIERHSPVNLLRMHGNTKWHEACNEIYQLVKSEQDINLKGEPVDVKPISDRRVAFEGLVMKYIRYVKSFNMLCDCYKWLVHPQKRTLLRRCIEAVAGRICEIKHEMINLDKCLYNYFDDMLIELSLTPSDLKLELPKYMLAERYRILQMRERLLIMMVERIKSLENPQLDDVICQMEGSMSTSSQSVEDFSTKPFETPQNTASSTSSVTQGRPSDVKQNRAHSFHIQGIIDHFNTNSKLKAKILLIQKRWRSWLCQQRMKRLKESEEIALGMRSPRVEALPNAREEADYKKREAMYQEREQELKISKAMEHERFMAAHGHNIAWELKYNITQWLLELRDLQGSFPDYPDEDEGGCEKLFAMKTTEEVAEEIDELLNPTPTQTQKAERKDQAKKAEVVEAGWKPAPTAAIPKLIDALEEYNSYWYLKDEMDNTDQKFDRQLMLEQVRDEAGKQIRLQVDDLMRYELDKLRCGIEFIEMDEKRRNARNAKAEEKEQVTKDPLASKTVEELYGELVLHGIVTPVKNIRLDDIIGEQNFGDSMQEDSMPTIVDIKTTLTHLLIFPLSSSFLHSVLPLTNRMLFVGPPGVGKTMMIHALCRETGANLFDISPHVLAGKYEGQEQQEYLMNALLKVGKSLEPTIFTMDDCDELFSRPNAVQLPGQDRPQRWVSVFSKMMDKMKKGDRMFLIGETTDPFTCNNRAMFDMFRNIIYFPRPEYGTRVLVWKTLLARKAPFHPSAALNPSVLAKFSDGYSVPGIELTVNETLTNKRRASTKKVTNLEFIMALTLEADSDPLDEDDVNRWATWYQSTPLMRKRRQLLDEENYARQLQEAM